MEVVSILVSMLPPFSSVWFWRESHLMLSFRTAAPGTLHASMLTAARLPYCTLPAS